MNHFGKAVESFGGLSERFSALVFQPGTKSTAEAVTLNAGDGGIDGNYKFREKARMRKPKSPFASIRVIRS